MVFSPLEAATEGTIDLAARNGLKTIALINVDTLPAKAVANGAIELAKKKGLEVVFHETYPPGTTDFSAILNKVKAAKPDVLVANYVPAEVIAMTRQMRELDVNVKMLSATPGGGFLDYSQGSRENGRVRLRRLLLGPEPCLSRESGVRCGLSEGVQPRTRPSSLRRPTPAANSSWRPCGGPAAWTPTSSGRNC